jgi:hypothetical protein
VKGRREEATLFDLLPGDAEPLETPVNDFEGLPLASAPAAPPDAPCREALPSPPVSVSAGEKGKARDILSAVRVLKAIEGEGRPATTEERQTLLRFSGFGPVALSVFPDPVTGHSTAGTGASR